MASTVAFAESAAESAVLPTPVQAPRADEPHVPQLSPILAVQGEPQLQQPGQRQQSVLSKMAPLFPGLIRASL